jgi:hypothetical protein
MLDSSGPRGVFQGGLGHLSGRVLFHVRQLANPASPMITLPALAKWLNLSETNEQLFTLYKL